jgi:hypothetical protein
LLVAIKIFINIVDNERVIISRWYKFADHVQAAARPEVVAAGEVAHRSAAVGALLHSLLLL